MSLLNNSNKKGKKSTKQTGPKTGMQQPKAKTNTKAATRNTRLTGGVQRGS